MISIQLYTVKEAAELLKTNTHMVYALIKAKHITALKLGRIKIPDYELERFIIDNLGKDLTNPEHVKVLGDQEMEESEEIV